MDYGQRPADACALLFNGRFTTMDRRCPRAEAMFVRGDRIEAVGTRPDVEACAAGPVRRIDLEGKCVVPGFIDAHVHAVRLGLRLRKADLDNPSKEERREAVLAAIGEAHRWGLTGIHDVEGELSLDVYEELLREGKLDLRIVFYVAGRNLDDLLKGGLRTGHGNEFLRFGGVTLVADGTLASRDAAMFEPYDDDPAPAGAAPVEREALRAAARRAAEGGIAVAVHAVGDRAVRTAIDVLEEAAPRRRSGQAPAAPGGSLRHRIERFQHVCAEDVPRLKPIDAVASMQPCRLLGDMALIETALKSRGERAYRLGSVLRAAVALAMGTDAPVGELNPFRNLYAAVTRRREDGTPSEGWHPEERITLEEAVRAYTLGSAWAAGEESIKGSLSPGKLADFAVLSRDIFAAPPEALLRTRVEMTVAGGNVVWTSV